VVHRMRVEQVAPFAREHQGASVVGQIDRLDEALVVQVVERLAVDVQVVLRHDPEDADRSPRAAVLAVQLVDAVTDGDQLELLSSRKVEVAHRRLARVVVAVAFVVHACAAVLPSVTVARVISRIEHGCPPDMALR
jgi:hypothetical protein